MVTVLKYNIFVQKKQMDLTVWFILLFAPAVEKKDLQFQNP